MLLRPYIDGIHPYVHRPSPRMLSTPWTLPALCAAYGLPRNLTGGNRIGIIELGGTASASDMEEFCLSVGMPVPNIVYPTSPFPSDPEGANVEIALDQQVAAFVSWWCTGKVPTLVMVWDETGNIYPGVASAAEAGCDVVSISWGAPENEWGKTAAYAMHTAAVDASDKGTAVFAASGDNDYSDGEPGAAHVDCPASCPGVVACSGTTKTTTSEFCWNNGGGEGTGGGYSVFFNRPVWQISVPKLANGRMVGDLAANADPHTGYEIVCGGQKIVVGGTSAVAPFWAALAAAIKAKPGTVEHQFYKNLSCLQRIVVGNNGKWPATVCDGLGVPIGSKVSGMFS